MTTEKERVIKALEIIRDHTDRASGVFYKMDMKYGICQKPNPSFVNFKEFEPNGTATIQLTISLWGIQPDKPSKAKKRTRKKKNVGA